MITKNKAKRIAKIYAASILTSMGTDGIMDDNGISLIPIDDFEMIINEIENICDKFSKNKYPTFIECYNSVINKKGLKNGKY